MLPKIKQYNSHTFSSLKIRNYRLYFTGQGISLCGTWLQTLAQTWLVLELTHSGTDIGLLVAAQFLPILLFGPLGGVIADRFSKRRILYMTQTGALLLALTLAILVQTHMVHLWMVFVLASLLGFVNVVDNPTRQSFIMEMVGTDKLTNAVTLNSVEVNLARVIGPTIGGLLISGVGIGYCFFINAASYVAVLLCLFLMDGSQLTAARRSTQIKGQLREGFAYVKNTPVLRNVLLMMVLIGTFSYEFQVVLPLFASRTFHGGAGTYALLLASMSIGAVIGGMITAGRRRSAQRTIAIAALIFGICLLLSAVAPNLILAAISLVAVGLASIAFSALANSTLQLESKPEMRGRVMSLWTVAFLGSTPIGGPIMGWLSDHSSPRAALAVGGVAAMIAAAFGAFMLHRMSQKRTETNVRVQV
jgi:MFS family permease